MQFKFDFNYFLDSAKLFIDDTLSLHENPYDWLADHAQFDLLRKQHIVDDIIESNRKHFNVCK